MIVFIVLIVYMDLLRKVPAKPETVEALSTLVTKDPVDTNRQPYPEPVSLGTALHGFIISRPAPSGLGRYRYRATCETSGNRV